MLGGGCLVVVYLWMFRLTSDWWCLLYVALVGVGQIRSLVARPADGDLGTIQVRLNPVGCVQFNELAGPSIIKQLFPRFGWIVLIALTVGIIAAGAILRNATLLIAAWISGTLGLAMLFDFRRRGRERSIPDEGAVADANKAFVRATAWAKVSRCTLRPAKESTQVLKIESRRMILGFVPETTVPVHAEITCTPEQAEALRQLLDAWLAKAAVD